MDTSFGAGAVASLPCALVADGLNDFVSGVETVPAPGPTVTLIGHRVVSGLRLQLANKVTLAFLR